MTECKSTRYGDGCGHPTTDHTGPASERDTCCCCTWRHNEPHHALGCEQCRSRFSPEMLARLDAWGGK